MTELTLTPLKEIRPDLIKDCKTLKKILKIKCPVIILAANDLIQDKPGHFISGYMGDPLLNDGKMKIFVSLNEFGRPIDELVIKGILAHELNHVKQFEREKTMHKEHNLSFDLDPYEIECDAWGLAYMAWVSGRSIDENLAKALSPEANSMAINLCIREAQTIFGKHFKRRKRS